MIASAISRTAKKTVCLFMSGSRRSSISFSNALATAFFCSGSIPSRRCSNLRRSMQAFRFLSDFIQSPSPVKLPVPRRHSSEKEWKEPENSHNVPHTRDTRTNCSGTLLRPARLSVPRTECLGGVLISTASSVKTDGVILAPSRRARISPPHYVSRNSKRNSILEDACRWRRIVKEPRIARKRRPKNSIYFKWKVCQEK
jgi:hypothetical protein